MSFHSAQVHEIEFIGDLATAVKCVDGTRFETDMIVIAGGQNFPFERMFGAYPIKERTRSWPIQITYRSLCFKSDSLRIDGYKQYYYQISPSHEAFGAVTCPIENGRSIATIVQYGNYVELKEDFQSLARRVPGETFSHILEGGIALGEVVTFYKPAMTVRDLHKVRAFPVNVFAIGDVLCSLNPVFGQGMTLALEQARTLQRHLLKKTISSRGFHRSAAARNRLPCMLSQLGSSTGSGFPERYLRSFLSRSRTSKRQHKKFLQLLHLKGSYSSLIDLVSFMKAVAIHG